MRQLGTAGGVLIAVASLALAACGSSGGHAATTPSTSRSTTSESGPTSTTEPHATTTLSPAAADAVAQFALTASLDAAKSIYDDTYDFTSVSPGRLTAMVPTVHYAPLDQATTTAVGVLAQDKNDVLFAVKSASGRWYCVTDNDSDGVSYGVGRTLGGVNSNGECQLDAWPAPGASS